MALYFNINEDYKPLIVKSMGRILKEAKEEKEK